MKTGKAEKVPFTCPTLSSDGDGKVNGWAWADPMKIDNVRIHSVALTEAEVRAIYDEERQ